MKPTTETYQKNVWVELTWHWKCVCCCTSLFY